MGTGSVERFRSPESARHPGPEVVALALRLWSVDHADGPLEPSGAQASTHVAGKDSENLLVARRERRKPLRLPAVCVPRVRR